VKTSVASKRQLALSAGLRQQDGIEAGQEFDIERLDSGENLLQRRSMIANEGQSRSIDEATDTCDTIEWVLQHVPNTLPRVGILGISYPGFLVDAVMVEPHPALKAMGRQAPMVDTWMGDDLFHQGAFRQSYATEWVHGREARAAGTGPLVIGRWDTYDWDLGFPTLGALARATGATGATKWPTWQRFVAHPAYDFAWSSRAVQRYLTHTTIPTLTVGGWWDQDDGYGPQASYAAMERTDSARLNNLVIGPWFHGQWFDEAADSPGASASGAPRGTTSARSSRASSRST